MGPGFSRKSKVIKLSEDKDNNINKRFLKLLELLTRQTGGKTDWKRKYLGRLQNFTGTIIMK